MGRALPKKLFKETFCHAWQGVGTRQSLRSPPTQTFWDSVNADQRLNSVSVSTETTMRNTILYQLRGPGRSFGFQNNKNYKIKMICIGFGEFNSMHLLVE